MNNTIQINKQYLVSGRYVKVTAITPTHIEVVWAHNGHRPVRQCDRFYSHRLTKHFVEVVPA